MNIWMYSRLAILVIMLLRTIFMPCVNELVFQNLFGVIRASQILTSSWGFKLLEKNYINKCQMIKTIKKLADAASYKPICLTIVEYPEKENLEVGFECDYE